MMLPAPPALSSLAPLSPLVTEFSVGNQAEARGCKEKLDSLSPGRQTQLKISPGWCKPRLLARWPQRQLGERAVEPRLWKEPPESICYTSCISFYDGGDWRELLFQPEMSSHWTLMVLFVPLLYLGSESPSGFVLCLAKDPGSHFSSGPRL